MDPATRNLDSASNSNQARASYASAADLLDGYVYEARFLKDDDSPDNRILWASEGFATVFGFTVDEYNRSNAWGRFYHEGEQLAAIERARALRRGEIVEAEIRVLRFTGEVRWLYLKNRPVFGDAQRVIGILGVGQDITPRKQAEASLRALEREIIEVSSREQHRIANDLHDGLGQDLTGISMMLRAITDRHTQGSPELASSLEEVILLVNRCIQDARALASGLAPLEIGQDRLAGALRALAIHTREISGIDIRFKCSGSRTSNNASPAAEDQLYRIAREAVYNALRHSGAKSIRIDLRSDRGGLMLRVRDNGCGFPENQLATTGMGMRIMEYRARTIEARLLVRRHGRVGASIICHLPAPPSRVCMRSTRVSA